MAQSHSDNAGAADRQAGAGASDANSSGDKQQNSNTDPIAMLKADHRHVEQLFAEFEKASDDQKKKQLAQEICTALVVHTMIEEEIFYPACQGHMEKRLLDEAQVEHDGAKALIVEIQTASPEDEYYDAKVKVLSEDIKHHVREEEKPREGILAKAKEGGVATAELAQRLAARKEQLMNEAQAGALDRPQTRSFRAGSNGGGRPSSKENSMARGSTATMERDERGRFVSDDDDDYRRRGRSRYDDDDDDRRSMRARDEEGRFTSRRSRYEDDDDRRGGRGRGGWFGDPEGHSEASREGWEGRRGSSRSRYDDDDDDRRYGRDRGQGGWFGDPEGHSRASREGWEERRGSRSRSRYDDDDDDRRGGRGHGGWYGDPRGHSEAAREGWEGRGDTRTRSRYDDDDDDDRRGRGHGGWYGDPEGHSEAARQRRR